MVIAIIASLLAILMPTLHKVKERAKQVLCKANLKGISMAIQLYLNDYDNRIPPKHGNKYEWFNPTTGKKVAPDSNHAYWGLMYDNYTEDPKVFSCSTFASMKATIYPINPGDILGGYGLNRHLEGMKVTSIKMPSQFIIAQDHTEPHPEYKDLFYILEGEKYNLEVYRDITKTRSSQYWTMFRHRKKSRSLDDHHTETERLENILSNPNGQSDTVWMDGSVNAIDETTGENVRKYWYTGK